MVEVEDGMDDVVELEASSEISRRKHVNPVKRKEESNCMQR